MRASSAMQEHLREYPSIKIIYNVQIQEIVGKDGEVTGVKLYNSKTKESSLLSVNGVFLAIGHTPNSQLVKSHVKTDEDGYIILEGRSQATNVPGVFAAGDVADRVYRQAGVASGHGIQAGLDAIAFLTSIGYNSKMAHELKKSFYSGSKKNDAKAELKALATEADFDAAVLKGTGLTIIKCWRPGCQACVEMAPIFEKAKATFADKAHFLEINTMAAPELAEKLHVYGVPTIFVYRDGKLVSRYNGAMNETEFDAFVTKFVNATAD
jgi:thiol-disulfide isomerase/thioredoxin